MSHTQSAVDATVKGWDEAGILRWWTCDATVMGWRWPGDAALMGLLDGSLMGPTSRLRSRSLAREGA